MHKIILMAAVGLLVLCTAVCADLIDNGDGTVSDTQTGLVWQQDLGNGGATLTWEAALVYCEGLDLAGHTDWRLPNRSELQTIVDYQRFNPTINTALFPTPANSNLWSSTTSASGPTAAWVVSTTHGISVTAGKTSSGYVRAVRTAP